MSDKSDKLRELDPTLMALAKLLAPYVMNFAAEEFGDRFEVMVAAQKDEDSVTGGVFNMSPRPGMSTPPNTPRMESVVMRHELEALKGWIEETRDYFLTQCKTRRENVSQKGGTTEIRLIMEDPDNAEQRKAKTYVEYLNSVISGITKLHERPIQRYISDFRDDLVIHRILTPGFLGITQGQRHTGATDKQLQSLVDSLTKQGKHRKKPGEKEEDAETAE